MSRETARTSSTPATNCYFHYEPSALMNNANEVRLLGTEYICQFNLELLKQITLQLSFENKINLWIAYRIAGPHSVIRGQNERLKFNQNWPPSYDWIQKHACQLKWYHNILSPQVLRWYSQCDVYLVPLDTSFTVSQSISTAINETNNQVRVLKICID